MTAVVNGPAVYKAGGDTAGAASAAGGAGRGGGRCDTPVSVSGYRPQYSYQPSKPGQAKFQTRLCVVVNQLSAAYGGWWVGAKVSNIRINHIEIIPSCLMYILATSNFILFA